MNRKLTAAERAKLHQDICPACGATPLTPGPRGGIMQNYYCGSCEAGWNRVAPDYRQRYFGDDVPPFGDQIRESRRQS